MNARPTSLSRPLRAVSLLLVILTAAGWACREVTIAPVPVRSVAIDPAGAELAVGERRAFRAVPVDSDGNVLEGRSVEWAVQDGSVAVVEPSGEVRAVAEGETRLQAHSEGIVGEAHLWVVPGPARDAEGDEGHGDPSGGEEGREEESDDAEEDDEDDDEEERDDEDDDEKGGNKGKKKGHG